MQHIWFVALSMLGLSTITVNAQNAFPSSGNVGIGTTSPQDALDIENGGYLRVGNFFHAGSEGAGSVVFAPSGNYIRFSVGSSQPLWLASSGNVGIGTGTPYSSLDIHATGSGANGLTLSEPSTGAAPFVTWKTGDSINNLFSTRFVGGTGAGWAIGSGDSGGFQALMTIQNAGNVGIGTASPGSKLEVNGSVKLTSGSGASITFPDGTVQSTAYTGVTCGGDYAESVDASGARGHYEPGDLLVLDAKNPGKILKSTEAYSATIAGIYSTRPGTIGRRQLTPKTDREIPMALVGIVPTKVVVENGPIEVGDLLVSSSEPGYAMKGTDRARMLGAVVGKAMGPLESGSGVIEVLVMLQ